MKISDSLVTGNIIGKSSLIVVFFTLCFQGCSHLGPQTVERDRFDYNAAISNSWKEQTLLNVVKIRYADMPLFVEVASVISSYSIEGSVNIGGAVSSGSAVGDIFNIGTEATYTDRPTITYQPITGTQFNKSFMTPIPPKAVLFLMQSGWPVDLIFPLMVDSVNGLRSRIAAGSNQRTGDPGYYRVIELLRKLQKSGATGMKIKTSEAGETTLMIFQRRMLAPEIRSALKEIDEILGLRPESPEVEVTYGFLPGSDTEVALLTRSLLYIMFTLAQLIEVPPEHVAEGRTVPSLPSSGNESGTPKQMIRVHTSTEKPENGFTSVKYRDWWFWIDDRDFQSKRTFTFMMILFSLMETGGREGLPLVTIPTN